ncbi:MAG: hypothetical protein O7G85_06280 [Planctomycetota bacterium]|nr:hypothetical protein [Planctomycetota bacterium]
MFPFLATTTAQPFPEMIIQMLILVGVVAIGIVLTMSIRGKISKKNAAIPPPKQQISQAKTHQRIIDDKNAMDVQMHDKARHLGALLDNKAERLEQLLTEADAKIREMQGLLNGASGNDAHPQQPQALPIDMMEETERITREIQSLQEPARVPETSQPDPAGTTLDSCERLDPLTKTVYELSDEGKDSVKIAQMLDEQIGKVELILALRES